MYIIYYNRLAKYISEDEYNTVKLLMEKIYKDGKITLREASDLLNLTPSETIDLLSEMGVKGNIHAKDVLTSVENFPSPQS